MVQRMYRYSKILNFPSQRGCSMQIKRKKINKNTNIIQNNG